MWLLVVSAVFLINSSLGFYARLSDSSVSSGGRNNADLIQTNIPYSGESTANRRLSVNNPGRSNLDSEMNREFINGNYDKQITIGSKASQSLSRNSNRDVGRLPNGVFGRGNRFEGTLFGNNQGRSNLDDGRVPNSGINYESNNGNFDKQITVGSRAGSERFGANYDQPIKTDFSGRMGSTQSRRSNLDDGRVPNSGINYESNNGNFDKKITVGSRAGSERFGANYDQPIKTDFSGRMGSTQSRRSNLDDGRVPNSGINYESNNGNFDKKITVGSRAGSERFGANYDQPIKTDFSGRMGSTQSRMSNLDDGRVPYSGINYESNNGNFDKKITIGSRAGSERFGANYDQPIKTDFTGRMGSTQSRRSNLDAVVSKGVSRMGSRFDRNTLRSFPIVGDGRRGSRGRAITVNLRPRANPNNAYTRF